MKALIVSLESFQKGEIPYEVKKYIEDSGIEPFIILDESSKIKTNAPCKEEKKSKRTQAVLKLNKTGERCILTGTFMSKSPVNAYDQMNFLCPNFFNESMYAFAERYEIRRNLPSRRGARIPLTLKDYESIKYRMKRAHEMDKKSKTASYTMATYDSIRSYYGIYKDDCDAIYNSENYTTFKNIDELWNRIGDTCIKVDRNEALDLPPLVYKTYGVDLTEAQKKLYLSLQNQHCTDNITVDNGLKLYLRFQDICNGYEPIETEEVVKLDSNGNEVHKVELLPLKDNPKLDMLEEIMDDLGKEQVVVWCSRTGLLYDAKARLDALGYTTGVYDGKNKNREADYQSFSKGETQVLLLNQASGAYGLDGLKECNYAIYLCNDYSVEHREQSIKRIYRGIVKESKYIIDITVKNTCEDRVVEALKQGRELLSTGETDSSIFLLKENA